MKILTINGGRDYYINNELLIWWYKIMIFDKLQNFRLYETVHPLFPTAGQWLEDTNLTTLPFNQKIIIDGDRLFAKTEEYYSFPSFERLFEGHRRYIDIQIIIEGAEAMETAFLKGDEKVEVPYTESSEIYFVHTQEESKVLLREGYFTMFFPHDLHKPCLNYSSKSEHVKKVTLKVLQEGLL